MSGTPAPEPTVPADGPETGDAVALTDTHPADGAGAADVPEGEADSEVTAGGVSERGGRGGAKSPTAFRTISEVSAELDVPQHVLRFWETKFPHIRPLKRGGGRRYYRPDDVEMLRRIQVLLYKEGYTIKGVQRLLRTPGRRPPSAPGPEAEVDDGMEPGDDGWTEAPTPPPVPPPVQTQVTRTQPEEKLRIIGLFDHDPEADPEWARTPPEPEPVAPRAPEHRAQDHRRVASEKGLPSAKREALGQVLSDLEEIRDLLRRVL
ncbi:MerR family transcriptional regulator [Nitrospirillum sp. BR 11828]|uniref:MerR family transcriptional regulator n=1 Tax=Nitrospirillum sp. BR 11828 TaxID=3104325 RepID=UPI002ACA04E1|nr:MerR family transcriptional regulator [Nitrospirillum sp. BR 11828]MDZ5647965.1 MerR family transcriptional regulator [Nitrospirillum sp. BR 11828]